MTTFYDSTEFLSQDFRNEEDKNKSPKKTGLARLSTPKPVIHLGSSMEFQRQGTGVPRTPFKPGTGYRSGTAFHPPTTLNKIGTDFKPGTAGVRPGTGLDLVNRPMTAVRGAGYTSHGKPFDPLNQASAMPTPPLELQKDDSPEEKIKQQEVKIMQLIEESCIAQCSGDTKKSLSKAKEASNKERSLIRFQEQAGFGEHNNDLTYLVLFNLANQYAANELYAEAINTYQIITKNRLFSNAYKLKINMGNIYYKQGHYQMAVKMFRMALDQVPSTQKILKVKIMHNIAMVFIKMGQWEEAISSLEYIMSEDACHKAGLHLVLCCRALDDKDRMRTSFSLLLSVPMEVEDEEKYKLEQDAPEDALIAMAIQHDDLHIYESKKRKEAEYCILTAAKLIANAHLDDSFTEGYDWCVNAIKNSEYARLAIDLEINKAVMFLKQQRLLAAIETLSAFEKDSVIAVNAAVNLIFIYHMQGDYDTAIRYGEMIKKSCAKSADGYVNYGATVMAKGFLDEAIECFHKALEYNPVHFEATYNLGLAYKRRGQYVEALECFQKFSGSLMLLPIVVYQVANLLELLGDGEAAVDTYQQLLGLVPTDARALQKLGELYDNEGEKQQAHHYHNESFRYYPANLSVIDWLGTYYIEMQVVEKALQYFEKAALMQPNEPKWNMMVAGCHRRSGNMHRALTLYKQIHQQFPENAECLKFLVRLCSDLGMREAQDYIMELKMLEKTKEVRDRVNSSRPGSRRSNSGLSSRAGSGFTPVLENVRSPTHSSTRNHRSSRFLQSRNSGDSMDSGVQMNIDASYVDPLGPQPLRPRTGVKKTINLEDFGNEELGDDLLPE